jgi:transposase
MIWAGGEEMKGPAQIRSWVSEEELLAWVREAADREVYQKRLAIWLTKIGPYHAQEVARMLGISKQAVWLWVGQYNKGGPEGLARQGRGGRRWALLPWSKEESLLEAFEKRALAGEWITAKQMLPEICKVAGGEVSLAYVYRLLRRHQWRKLGPRPRHVKADPKAQEEFKKNFRFSSRKR